MLNEIIDIIGLNEIEKGLSNEDLSGSLVFLLNEENLKQIDMSNEANKTNLEEKEYIKQRLFYSNYINSDKAVVQDKKYKTIKMALGANKFSISFNVSKLLENGQKSYEENYRKIFDDVISDYYETLRNKFQIKIGNEEELINKYSEQIFTEVMKVENKKKKVRIFIEASIERYKEEFEKYFYLMISDSDTEAGIRKDKELFRLFKEQGGVKVALFSTLNADKPLLSNVGARLSYSHIYNKENLMKFYKLKKYMEMNIKTQKFSFGDKKLFVLYDCKEKRIDDYEQKVYKKDDIDEFNFTIEDLLGFNFEEKKIKSRKMIIEELNSYIDFSITKTPTRGKARNLNQKYKNILLWSTYNEVDKKYEFAIDDEMFDIKIKSLINDVLIYNKVEKAEDEYGILNMQKILNIKFALNSMQDTEVSIKGDEVLRIKDLFKDMLLSDLEKEFDSHEEFMFAIGQLAICLANKSKSKKMNSMIGGYQNVRDYNRLISLLENDMRKYAHTTMIGSKENKIFGQIKTYMRENDIKGFISNVNKDWLDIGLYSKNLFYTKKEK
ncbi:MAG: hypothetical protein ACRDCW_17725 [Sarcina sp.]